MKVLVKAGLVFTKDLPLRDVYIGINNEKIEVISKDEPEDYDDAELSIGGLDRLVSPGFISIQTFLSLYPFRYRIFSGKLNANDIVSVMDEKDVYYFSLLAGYHLLKTGITKIITADPKPEHAARALTTIGLKPIIAVSVGCNWGSSDWKREFKALYSRWSTKEENRVIIKLCDEEDAEEVFGISNEYKIPVLVDRSVNLSRFKEIPRNTIALGGGSRKDLEVIRKENLGLSFTPSYEICKFTLGSYMPSISLDSTPGYDIRTEMGIATSRLLLTSEEAFRSATIWGYKQVGIEEGIERGSLTDLIIFEVNEPPSYPLDKESPFESIIYSSYNLETAIVGGEAILDGGVPLNIEIKDLEEANRRVEEIDGKHRNMEKD